MKRLFLIATALMGMLGMTFAMAPAASAYPELVCNVTVSPQTVQAGEPFTVTCSLAVVESSARVSAIADETEWVLTFNGETRTGTGATLVETFVAPDVDERTVLPLNVVGTNEAGTCERTVNITIVPQGEETEPPGGLPGTGGPAFYLLIGGLALLVVGGLAVHRSRQSSYQPRH